MNRGYIALISAVIISVVLLTLITGAGWRGYQSRFNILNSELKAMSASLAEACVDTAILKLAEDNSYSGNKLITVGSETCQIKVISPGASPVIIETSAEIKNAHTNLRIEVPSVTNLVISGWQEIP